MEKPSNSHTCQACDGFGFVFPAPDGAANSCEDCGGLGLIWCSPLCEAHRKDEDHEHLRPSS